ncbi:MAG: LysM peptidoglycan-binding domain-containing protein [Candidatus Omnitrophica bacterium]|nr:LysM peptidoglycan-binding domain-containing protein [Candidatus Omnitrophota bacterium]MCF7877908.1 LysM peptidoglycan-binding domain-containing protein [Candidatus Omnitrophota bacterium]MCF7893082.1 LysM peptidoglycan-binding domain-containing protein [Candidatus Omnitrophota bacterium]
MRKILFLLFIVFLSGCMRVRTYTVEKPRKDRDIEGNQGYLLGESDEVQKDNKLGSTRKISVLEFEFGPKSKEEVASEVLESEEVYQQESGQKDVSRQETAVSELKVKEYDINSPQYEYEDYTIKKNDTLQKISRKFYGTTKKWELIYQENKDSLTSPDKIYPGMKIKIPVLR